jgi:hypothetical protein
MFRDAPRDLVLAYDDEIRAELCQVFDFLVGMRARNDLEIGVCRACLLDKIAVFEWIRDCADKPSPAGISSRR